MKHRWIFNILVIALMGYFCASAAGDLLEAGREPGPSPEPPPAEAGPKPKAAPRPLSDYRVIWERNLFSSSENEAPAPEEEVSLEGLAVTMKALGLKLVGTVVGDDSAMNFAFIDNQATRKQEAYHEGDRVGQALIKKILRNNVVLNTGSGDEVLTMEHKESAGSTPVSRASVGSEPAAAQSSAIRLDRAEVEPYFADINALKQVYVKPIEEVDGPAGFMIRRIRRGSIPWRMGFRNGDLIKSVNGKAISSPDQADTFFQTLKEGGEITVEIKRSGLIRQLQLEIG
jgi:type II secretion system protein C